MRMTETRLSQKVKNRTTQPGNEGKLEYNPKSRKKEKKASKTSES